MELHTDSSTTVVLGQWTMWHFMSRKPWTNGLGPSIQGQEWVGLIVDR